jgi:hypothetical protein
MWLCGSGSGYVAPGSGSGSGYVAVAIAAVAAVAASGIGIDGIGGIDGRCGSVSSVSSGSGRDSGSGSQWQPVAVSASGSSGSGIDGSGKMAVSQTPILPISRVLETIMHFRLENRSIRGFWSHFSPEKIINESFSTKKLITFVPF